MIGKVAEGGVKKGKNAVILDVWPLKSKIFPANKDMSFGNCFLWYAWVKDNWRLSFDNPLDG